MRIHLGGHLVWYDPQKRPWFELDLRGELSLSDLLSQLSVPVGEVALIVVNGELVSPEDCMISMEDLIELYPPMGGGSGGS